MKKFVLVPDSFKGTLSSAEICGIMQEEIAAVFPDADIRAIPVADGGEGSVDAFLTAIGGEKKFVTVKGPYGESMEAFYGRLSDTLAVVEMAAAAGLPLAGENRHAEKTTTYGVGQLIEAAARDGAKKIIVGLGGSATNDGGAGMAQALGFRLLDDRGAALPYGGAALQQLARIDAAARDPRLTETEILVACDVTNPLIGPNGAAAVYGPQKGASPEMVVQLDQALTHFAAVVARDRGVAIAALPGAGAAGGLGGGLVAFLGARLQRGVEMVIEAVRLKEKMAGAALVITGEGRIDGQSAQGKTPVGVAAAAKELGLPVLAVAGGIGPEVEAVFAAGIDGVTAITDHPMTLAEAVAAAPRLVAAATERMIRIYRCGSRFPL